MLNCREEEFEAVRSVFHRKILMDECGNDPTVVAEESRDEGRRILRRLKETKNKGLAPS
jgi:hypothetical protein